MREYTIIALGDPVKVLISSWGLKDDTHLSAFVLNNAPCLAWTWLTSVYVCNPVTVIGKHTPSEVTQVSIFFALASKMQEKIRFHRMSEGDQRLEGPSQKSAHHIWISPSPLQRSCQGYLRRRPTSLWAQRPSNACPILTSFGLPTGLWFSTRPGKSNYTGVREVDFPIIESMLRMSTDDNTHNHTTTAPSLSSLSTYFVSISLFPSFYSSLSSYLIPLFPMAFFLPPSLFFASLPLSLSIILIFPNGVTKPGCCHHFRPQTTGSPGELHTVLGTFCY